MHRSIAKICLHCESDCFWTIWFLSTESHPQVRSRRQSPKRRISKRPISYFIFLLHLCIHAKWNGSLIDCPVSRANNKTSMPHVDLSVIHDVLIYFVCIRAFKFIPRFSIFDCSSLPCSSWPWLNLLDLILTTSDFVSSITTFTHGLFKWSHSHCILFFFSLARDDWEKLAEKQNFSSISEMTTNTKNNAIRAKECKWSDCLYLLQYYCFVPQCIQMPDRRQQIHM